MAQYIQFIPLTIMGLVYAIIAFIVARKRRINPWGWAVASLVPLVGIGVSAVFMVLTLFSVLDRLNKLEAATGSQAAGEG